MSANADLAGWIYWREVALSPATPTTDYQVKVTLDSATFDYADCKPDGADIRFSDETGDDLPHWIETWNPVGTSTLWVKVADVGTATIRLYYGNESAAAASDGAATFDFFDDFSGDLSQWTKRVEFGTITLTDGYVECGGGTPGSPYGHTALGTASYAGFGNAILEGRLYLSATAISEVGFRGSFAANTGYKARFDARAGEGISFLKPPYSGSSFLVGKTGVAVGNSGWKPFSITVSGTSFTAACDGRSQTSSDSAFAGPGDISLQNHFGTYARYDDVRVRKLAASEPVATVGGENEVLPGFPIVVLGTVTNITTSSAWLCGNLTSTGASDTAVIAYWGTTDGGTSAANWAASAMLEAPRVPGAFSFPATGLAANSTLHYRVAASNDVGVAWAATRAFFITGELTLTNTTDAVEATLTPGIFTVSRPGTATSEALSVAYAQTGGTAASGKDFAPIGGSVTIPAGAASATIAVTPLKNYALMADTTLEVTLTGAQAVLGSNTNATMTIINEGIPGSPTNVWMRSGSDAKASTAVNWSLGHCPTNGEFVYLGPYSPTPDMTWDVTNTVAGWVQTAEYAGTVSFATTFEGLGFPVFTIAGNATLGRGTWTHAANAAAPVNRLAVNIGGDLTVGTGAVIRADGKGYGAGLGPAPGPASGQGTFGAGHGGMGGLGSYSTTATPPPPYGSFAEPMTLGSGTAAAGGGSVRLVVAGATRVDGAIMANGVTGGGRGGGSAGGSVFLTTGSLEGTGQIVARGGPGTDNYGGAGGGGRVAVALTASETFGDVTMSAASVKGTSFMAGSAGTVYRQAASQGVGEGTLVIDNENLVTSWSSSTLMPEPSAFNSAPDLAQLAEIIVRNQGILGINTNTVFDFGVDNLAGQSVSSAFVMVAGTNALSFPAAFALPTDCALLLNVPVTATGDWTVPAGAVLSHRENYHQEMYTLNLKLDGNLTVDAGGEVSVTRKGYAKGLGPGSSGGVNYVAGASHGGMGGWGCFDTSIAKPVYGSALAPVNLGSGGYFPGVGAIRLEVSGTTTVNGLLFAGERQNSRWCAGPSGGSIWLRTGQLQGSGLLDAAGAYGGLGDAGAGGGGRISVILTAGESFGGVRMKAPGGNNNPQTMAAAAGTVYTEAPSQGAGGGRLLIANDNQNVGIRTNTVTSLPVSIGMPTGELDAVTLVVSNRASVALSSDLRIGDLYVLTNTPNFLYLNGHTLRVNHLYHKDWGREQDVIYAGGQIIWSKQATMFLLR